MIMSLATQPENENTNTELTARPPCDDNSSPAVLTVPEASKALRVSRWTLYDLIRSRALETIKIGRRRLIPVRSLTAYIRRKLNEDLE